MNLDSLSQPVHMVIINIIASVILLGLILFYKFIYPKQNINLFFLLLLVSLLPIMSIFRSGDYQSGDFNIHIYRIISFYENLKSGIFMPSWASDLNATYGNPLFIFNYNLPYYFISLIHFIGLSFIVSTKTYLAIVMYFSSITMYAALKELTKNKTAAFIGSIFYLFAPYHLIDIHFRATLGESTIFLIAPLLFLFISKSLLKQNMLYFCATSLITAILFLAHPLLAIVFCVLSELFIIFRFYADKNLRAFIKINFSIILGVLGSIYMWAPFLIYSNLIFPNPNPVLTFYKFSYFFYSPWKFGLLFQGPHGELAQIIGYTQIAIVSILTFFVLTKRIYKKIKINVIFWLLSFWIYLFLASPFSSFAWKFLPIFWMLLPFGRLMLPIAFITSVLASLFYLLFKNKINPIFFTVILIFTIGYTILNWGHRTLINIDDSFLIKNVPLSTLTEGTTAYFLNNKWADINHFWFSKIPTAHLEIIKGKGTVKEISRSITTHTYSIKATSNLIIKENTLFFPGWSISLNGEKINIFPGKYGIIYAKIPKGKYNLKLAYEDVFTYRVSKIISALFILTTSLTIILLLIYDFLSKPQHFTGNIESPLRLDSKKNPRYRRK